MLFWSLSNHPKSARLELVIQGKINAFPCNCIGFKRMPNSGYDDWYNVFTQEDPLNADEENDTPMLMRQDD